MSNAVTQATSDDLEIITIPCYKVIGEFGNGLPITLPSSNLMSLVYLQHENNDKLLKFSGSVQLIYNNGTIMSANDIESGSVICSSLSDTNMMNTSEATTNVNLVQQNEISNSTIDFKETAGQSEQSNILLNILGSDISLAREQILISNNSVSQNYILVQETDKKHPQPLQQERQEQQQQQQQQQQQHLLQKHKCDENVPTKNISANLIDSITLFPTNQTQILNDTECIENIELPNISNLIDCDALSKNSKLENEQMLTTSFPNECISQNVLMVQETSTHQHHQQQITQNLSTNNSGDDGKPTGSMQLYNNKSVVNYLHLGVITKKSDQSNNFNCETEGNNSEFKIVCLIDKAKSKTGYIEVYIRSHTPSDLSNLECNSNILFDNENHLWHKEEGDKSKSRRWNYVCDVCKRSLSSRDSLRHHLNIHLGLLPQKCDTCEKCFGSLKGLHNHINRSNCSLRNRNFRKHTNRNEM